MLQFSNFEQRQSHQGEAKDWEVADLAGNWSAMAPPWYLTMTHQPRESKEDSSYVSVAGCTAINTQMQRKDHTNWFTCHS